MSRSLYSLQQQALQPPVLVPANAPASTLDDQDDDDIDAPLTPLDQATIDDVTHFAEQRAEMEAAEEAKDPSYTPSTSDEPKRTSSTRKRALSKNKRASVVIDDDDDDEVGTVHALAYLSLTSF